MVSTYYHTVMNFANCDVTCKYLILHMVWYDIVHNNNRLWHDMVRDAGSQPVSASAIDMMSYLYRATILINWDSPPAKPHDVAGCCGPWRSPRCRCYRTQIFQIWVCSGGTALSLTLFMFAFWDQSSDFVRPSRKLETMFLFQPRSPPRLSSDMVFRFFKCMCATGALYNRVHSFCSQSGIDPSESN